MRIFLDDLRFPNMSHNNRKGLGINFSDENDWVIVRDYSEFCKLINNNFSNIELISFDHDLACFDHDGNEMTGQDCVYYLIQHCLENNLKFPDWYIHSDNSVGRENMIKTILNFLNKIENKDISCFRYYDRGLINNVFV